MIKGQISNSSEDDNEYNEMDLIDDGDDAITECNLFFYSETLESHELHMYIDIIYARDRIWS